MSIVEVKGLCKKYPEFTLDSVGFTLEKGRITGFIGRNGAGKTITIKSMLNLVHPDAGEVAYFGLPLKGNEAEIKTRIGYSTGSLNYYPRKKLKDLIAVMPEQVETVIVELDYCNIDMTEAIAQSYRYMVENGLAAGNK